MGWVAAPDSVQSGDCLFSGGRRISEEKKKKKKTYATNKTKHPKSLSSTRGKYKGDGLFTLVLLGKACCT
jgi:hypothetical protein